MIPNDPVHMAVMYYFKIWSLSYQDYYVGTCKTLYFGLPSDGPLALNHVGIL